MKANKGITLISLIIYVIVMLIVVTIIGTITSFFYANVNDEYAQNKDDYKNANLEMYLEKDLKNKEVWITNINGENVTSGTPFNTLKFIYDDLYSITYSIKNDGIYRNSIKVYDKLQTDEMHFEITDVPSNSESIIQDKQEIKIVKADSTVFKSYTVNVRSKANFPTPTPTTIPTATP